ncbi:MAG TPA: hypothetical protein VMA77_28895 [Solirubrobacteraceae bacterium]|nr:hypothetical protein [Solirubrobacteraceae bacterium]
MLVAPAADTSRVISRAIKLVSFVCCLLVVLSFGMFGLDQAAGASAHQQTELASGSNTVPVPVASSKPHAQPRRFIDAAAKDLTAPFDAIVRSNNPWVAHGVPAVFALLVYGLGLGYLARYSSGLSRR